VSKDQLKNELEMLRIDPSAYCLTGGLPVECQVHNQKSGETWEVYYSERGEKTGLRAFDSEASACQFFLEEILHDSAVRRI
jgi:hypothetical protein